MNRWTYELLLFAQRDVFRDMGSGFRDKKETLSGMDMLLYLLLVVVLFSVIGLIAWILGRQDQHQLFNSPRAMFRTLCRAHGLDKSARRLLSEIASTCKLKQPAEIFLSPQCLTAARQNRSFQEHWAQIDRLAATLFFVEPDAAALLRASATTDPLDPKLAALVQAKPASPILGLPIDPSTGPASIGRGAATPPSR